MAKFDSQKFLGGVATVGGFTSLISFLLTCGISAEVRNIKNDFNEIIDSTKQSGLFAEYKMGHEVALVDAYRRGEITGKELSNRLAVLESVDFVYDNRNIVMSDEDAKKAEKLTTEKQAYNVATAVTASTCVGGGVAGFMAYYLKEKMNGNKDNKPKRKISFAGGCSCDACKGLSSIDEVEFEF